MRADYQPWIDALPRDRHGFAVRRNVQVPEETREELVALLQFAGIEIMRLQTEVGRLQYEKSRDFTSNALGSLEHLINLRRPLI